MSENPFPPLSEEEYEGLKASIASYGVLVPVFVDQHGRVLDGFHRLRACEELGLDQPKRVVMTVESDEHRAGLQEALNLHRRNVTPEMRRALLAKLRPTVKLALAEGHLAVGIGTDDYPSERDLKTIADWPAADPEGWFAFVRERWWAADWGWREYSGLDEWGRPVRVYALSTAGWSGNESLIDAMERNWMLWGTTWQMSRRGGHYRFEVVLKEDP